MRDFYLGYKKIDVGSPARSSARCGSTAPEGLVAGFEKVAKRRALDIATVNLALTFVPDGEGKPTAGRPRRRRGRAGAAFPAAAAPSCSKAPRWTTILAAKLLATAQEEIAPISDVRGSAEYKRLLVRQLLIAQLTKHFPAALQVEDFYRRA